MEVSFGPYRNYETTSLGGRVGGTALLRPILIERESKQQKGREQEVKKWPNRGHVVWVRPLLLLDGEGPVGVQGTELPISLNMNRQLCKEAE